VVGSDVVVCAYNSRYWEGRVRELWFETNPRQKNWKIKKSKKEVGA
jgi:hypothetical protein